MPYDALSDLPDALRHVLPVHAQEIYRAAYNHAWDAYADPGDWRDPSDSREETAHKVAWGAVERQYETSDGRWLPRRRHARYL